MNILHIDCSPRLESHSRALSAALVSRLVVIGPEARVTRRDLGRDPIPHTDADYAAALSSPGAMDMGRSNGALSLSEQLIQEVEAADVVVIGTPMNNFTLPSVFKAWIDQLLRIGRTMGVAPDGRKTGLLLDKPVHIGIASGGFFTGDRARQPDFLTPYLQAALACVGLHSLRFFPLQGTAFLSRDQLDEARDALLATLDSAHSS
ncbi:MAG: flavodoxin family protein [Lysobacteraceae bacterium]|nr:MAG: flavodoxin family protein [Xanthomonadaceae bacterium]